MNLKKLRNSKGFTGTDVALSAGIIVLTMGIVMAIYVNISNNSKETIRYSAATRIATQIIETIQADTYAEVVYRCDNTDESFYSSSDGETSKIFGVNVPEGYSAKVSAEKPSGKTLDVVRDITVTVTYTISNNEKSVTLYTTKEQELLEQTNAPDLSLIDGYSDSNYYAVKYTGSSYVVTATSDPDWYNYEAGYYALLFYDSATSHSYGEVITASTLTATSGGTALYIWVPKYGGTSKETLAYCYGTSNYKIDFGTLTDSNISGYRVYGSYSNDSWNYTTVSNVNSAFDGVSGIWFAYGSDDTVFTNYKSYNTIYNLAE